MENGGKQARIGKKFHEALENIQINRIKKETSKDKISMEKITNLIIKHKSWKEINTDLINIKEEEIINYGR